MHVKSFDIYLSVSDSCIVDVVLKCCLFSMLSGGRVSHTGVL